MKKIVKIMGITGVIAFILGIIFVIAGFITGGGKVIAHDFYNIDFVKNIRSSMDIVDENRYNEMVGLNLGQNSFKKEQVNKIILEGEAGEFEFRVSDSEDITINNISQYDNVRYSLENGELYIASVMGEVINLFKSTETKVIVNIPKNFVLEAIRLNVGAGKVDCSDIITETLIINAGMGEVDYEGTINGNAEIECGVGEVKVEMYNEISEFNYSANVGTGKIMIGEKSVSGFDNELKIDNNKEKNITIDCGMGEVEISAK